MKYEMESARMYFRRVQADDADTLAPILRDETTMQAFGRPLSYEETLDWLVDTLRRYQQDGCGWLLALDKPTGAPVALCGLTFEKTASGERILAAGCIVRHELRQIGVGTECIRTCLRYALGHSAERVSAFVPVGNLAALHTAVSCGLQPVEKCTMPVFGKPLPHIRCEITLPQNQTES